MGSRNRVTLLRSFLLIVNCSQGLEPHSFVFCNPHVRLFFLEHAGSCISLYYREKNGLSMWACNCKHF
jgi:hypothetical protein